jgi:DNA-directed RNA polymerase subunit beta'
MNNFKMSNYLHPYDLFAFETDPQESLKLRPYQEAFKKVDLAKLIEVCFNRYGAIKTAQILDEIKTVGFEYSTMSGVSFSLDDILKLENKPKILYETEVAIAQIENYYQQGLLTAEEKSNHVIQR